MDLSETLTVLKQTIQQCDMAETANIPTMIAEFADSSRLREIKIRQIANSMKMQVFVDDDAETGSFKFKHNRWIFRVSEISVNYDGDEYDEVSGLFWEFHGVRCRVSVQGFVYDHAQYFVGAFTEIAKNILELIDDKHFCKFCGQLHDSKDPICRGCALDELDKPCFRRKIIMGRAHPTNNIHPCCYRQHMGINL